jgi:15-cis-phytoene synthase/lycopene beta-cyclase
MADRSKAAIEKLPREARGGIRAACLVYLTIGGAVDKALDEGRVYDRATVKRGTRARTAWAAL